MITVRGTAIFVSIYIALFASSAWAGGDMDSGRNLFASKCAACHSRVSGTNLVGPSLANVYGRKAGTVPNFNYSSALRNSGIVWDESSLNKWLTSPQSDIPGNHMPFRGIADPQRRADLIAYLKTL